MTGIILPGISQNRTLYTGIINYIPADKHYPLFGLVNIVAGDHSSAQFGLLNQTTGSFRGFQAGLANQKLKNVVLFVIAIDFKMI